SHQEFPMSRPNVLFICADQWRGDCLSVLGHSNVRTPNIDALAADGLLFRNHFSQCTPCGPSRTSLLTGLYLMNHRSGRNGTPLDARHTNIEHDFRTVVTQQAERALGIGSDECSYAVIRDRRYKYVHFAALPPLLFD